MKIAAAFLMLLVSATGYAQDYPQRPVRVLVGYGAGGGMDAITRLVAPKLSAALGQPFVVENRPGGAGSVAAEALVASAPDGYTLMAGESGTLALPSLNSRVRIDPVKEFAPVGSICVLPMAFVVNPKLPAKTTTELIALLKASPGKYSYASPGVGTIQHLAFELFQRSAGVQALHVPYKGAASMMPDLLSGEVPIGVVSSFAALGPTKAGRLRTLGVTSVQRVPSIPEWPTIAETLPGFNAAPSVFMVAPAATPAAVIARLNAALQAAVRSKDVEESFAKQGATPMPSSAEALGAQIAEETRRWATVVREAGIKTE